MKLLPRAFHNLITSNCINFIHVRLCGRPYSIETYAHFSFFAPIILDYENRIFILCSFLSLRIYFSLTQSGHRPILFIWILFRRILQQPRHIDTHSRIMYPPPRLYFIRLDHLLIFSLLTPVLSAIFYSGGNNLYAYYVVTLF